MAFYTIHPREISAVLRGKRGIMIDVREREEYQKDHYQNARSCPYEEIETWKRCLPRNRALILYCDYGSTSLLAARELGREGYQQVYTVVGGIHAIRNYEGS